jgi:hypothetical protein
MASLNNSDITEEVKKLEIYAYFNIWSLITFTTNQATSLQSTHSSYYTTLQHPTDSREEMAMDRPATRSGKQT